MKQSRKRRSPGNGHAATDFDRLGFAQAGRFDELQRNFLKNGLCTPDQRRWPRALLMFEAIADTQDLQGIQASGVVYADGTATRLDWVRPDGRHDARHLSCVSILALALDGNDPRAGGHLMQMLDDGLATDMPGTSEPGGGPAAQAVACSRAWLKLKLPLHLFNHITGVTPMTPLPRTTLARSATGLALVPPRDEESDQPVVRAAVVPTAYFHASGDDSSRVVLHAILEGASLRGGARLGDRPLLERMARRWRGLSEAAEETGPISGLLVAFVEELAIQGNHSPRSLVPYVKYGAPVVLDAFAGRELVALTSEELGTAVSQGLARHGLAGECLRKARAFLGLFLGYARQWLEIAPLPASALPDVEPAAVDANVACPHEVTRMLSWLAMGVGDGRLVRQTSLVLRLLRHIELRVTEVFFTQLRNVRISNGTIEFETALQGRLHGLKSRQAQQARIVRDPLLATELLEWKQVRRDEGGLDADLLFGTRKAQRRVYRLAAMYGWLNAALKQATGLREACCHWLRHSVIDERFVRISVGLAPGDSLDQLSVDASHLDRDTTQRNYLHRYPIVLRKALDDLLHKTRLPSAWAARWAGVSADKLRQDYHRQQNTRKPKDAAPQMSGHEYNWSAVSAAALRLKAEPAQSGMVMCEPLPPPSVGAARRPSVLDMLGLLADLQEGVKPKQAGMQWHFDATAAAAATGRLLELGNACVRLRRAGICGQLTTPQAALQAMDLKVSQAWQPKYLQWLKALDKRSVPPLPADAWQDWTEARRQRYISLEPEFRSDRWLAFVVATGFPASKLVVCQAAQAAGAAADALQDLELALGQAQDSQAVGAPRGHEVSARKGRPEVYLLVADEADELTTRNGAAFSPGGLAAVMLALHLHAIAIGQTTNEGAT